MKFIKEFLLSITSYLQAIKLISKFQLLKHVVVLLILVLLFVFPVMMFGGVASVLSALIPYFDTDKYAEIGVSFMASMSGFFLLIILIPVFSMVSEEVGNKLKGKEVKFSFKQLVKDMARGLKITLRNLFYEYLFVGLIVIILSFLSEVYYLSKLGQLMIFVITSYFYGFSILDYAMENHQMNYRKSVDFARSHLGLLTGLGMVYYLTISLDMQPFFKDILGNISLYWVTFAEAIVAFVGVIAANIVLNKALQKEFV